MPTSKRQVYDNAIYHIIQRGNNCQRIFNRDEDRKKFVSLIKEYKSKYFFELYNYCLMENHIHLLIKVFKKEDLAKLTQGIFQSFRFYFRKEYQYEGYLYQGRYKSKIIEKDEYLLECARYIETNPLRAKVIKRLKDYRWSSYNFYAYGYKNALLTPNPLYGTFGNGKKHKEFYRQYVLMPRMYEDIIDEALGV